MMETSLPKLKSKSLQLSLFSWAIVLLASDLPNAIWQAARGAPPAWLFWAKIGLLLVFILISLVWKPIQIVRPYFFLLLVLILALRCMDWLRGTDLYSQWENRVSWVVAMAGFHLLKLTVVYIMVIVLLLMGRRWKDFFLTRGQIDAPIRTVNSEKDKGKRPISWGLLGFILGICIAPLTLLFFGLGNLPTSSILIRALPYSPAACSFCSHERLFRRNAVPGFTAG